MITAAAVASLICRLFLNGDESMAVSLDTKLIQEGICDSLGLVTLALELEKQYSPLRILDQEITQENFGSIRELLRFLSQKGCEVRDQ